MRTCAIFLCLLAAGVLIAGEPSAAGVFSSGRKAEKAGRMAEAYVFYARAAAMDPAKPEYWERTQAVREPALKEIQVNQAKALSDAARPVETAKAGAAAMAAQSAPEPPTPSPFSPPTPAEIAEAQQPLPPIELNAEPELKSYDLRGNARTLFEGVAGSLGLTCEFDREFDPGPVIPFRLIDVDYRTALHGLEAATDSFIVPLSATRFLVAQDTPQKRTELEPRVAVEVRLPMATNQEDLTNLLKAVQQAMNIQRIAWNTQTNTIILCDFISKVLPARDMFRNFIYSRAQVMIEMQFLEISRNDAITYGIDFQTQFPLIPLTTWMNNKPGIPDVLNGLLTFGGGKSLLGLGVIDPALVARMSQSSGNILLRSVARSISGQPVTLHVGDRYPVQMSGYFGPSDFTPSGESVYKPPPMVSFEDLGLTLKVTPSVHGMDEATLDVDAEFKLLTGAGVNGIPILSNRSLKSIARLRFGQWAAIAGLINGQEARNISGVAALSKIPVLGPLFSTRDNDKSRREVLILLRPHLLTPPPSEMKTWSFHVGSETKPITPL